MPSTDSPIVIFQGEPRARCSMIFRREDWIRVGVIGDDRKGLGQPGYGISPSGERGYLGADGTSGAASSVNRRQGESWDGKRLEIKTSPESGMV